MTDGCLEGRCILLVEDDYMQAREMTLYLQREGARVVGPSGRASDVPLLLADQPVDAALLDINLGQGAAYETAQFLSARGVPFAFLTGYDHSAIPEEFAGVPCLNKPAREADVGKMLVTVLEQSGS